ncbi:hypothetical protein LCGC14_1048280 [marine sediment metagenome]|uniref:Uncharacterized protein n=1 Tax=marine sediment metagenome TaxID=412755 RepID=A0A0F9MU48_9ZZZZ
MAEGTIKIILDPDTRKLDRALKGKRIGGGVGVDSKEAKKQTKNSGAMVGLSTKMLGKLGIVSAIIMGLDFIIRPVLAILKAILTLLFLPLLPVFKPALKAMAAFMPVMVKISKGLTKVVQGRLDQITGTLTVVLWTITKLFNIFKGFVKGIATLGLWVWTEIIKPGFESLLDVGDRIWTEILKPGFDFVRSALINVANAIINIINNLPGIKISPVKGLASVITGPNQSFQAPNQSFPGTSIQSTININNSVVREKSDIGKIADAVSKVIARGILRGGILSLQ